jgi:hypothetical protein
MRPEHADSDAGAFCYQLVRQPRWAADQSDTRVLSVSGTCAGFGFGAKASRHLVGGMPVMRISGAPGR